MCKNEFWKIWIHIQQQRSKRGQLQAMLENVFNERDIFLDKQSNFNREKYQLLNRMIRKEDIL